MSKKTCNKCKKTKKYQEFHKHKAMKDGHATWCKECRKQFKEPKEKRWKRHLKYKFNITADDYNKLFLDKEGKCKICSISQLELDKKLCVDHCHKTNIIRGLLCDSCNVSIGRFNDDVNLLKNAINYLEDNNYESKE